MINKDHEYTDIKKNLEILHTLNKDKTIDMCEYKTYKHVVSNSWYDNSDHYDKTPNQNLTWQIGTSSLCS